MQGALPSRAKQFFLVHTAIMWSLAAVVYAFESIGAERMYLIGILLLVVWPIGLLVRYVWSGPQHVWIENLVEVTSISLAVNVVPHLWHIALQIALLVALMPGVNTSSFRVPAHAIIAAVLLTGFAVSGYVHNVPYAALSLTVLAVVYPFVLWNAYIESSRLTRLVNHRSMLHGIKKVTGVIAHEVNNRLAVVLGHAELERNKPGKTDSLHQIVEHAHRAGALTESLLAMSDQSLSAENEEFCVAELIEQITNMCTTWHAQHVVEVEVPPRHLAHSNRAKVSYALLCLLMNNIDNAQSGERIKVALHEIDGKTTIEVARFYALPSASTNLGIDALAEHHEGVAEAARALRDTDARLQTISDKSAYRTAIVFA